MSDSEIQALRDEAGGASMSRAQKIASRAARWWSDQLASGATGDAGDGMVNMLNVLQREREQRPSAEALAAFRGEIERVVIEGLSAGYPMSLSVDYGPDRELYDALRGAQITAQLPIKTSMVIDRDGARVKAGYGAPWVELQIDGD